MEQSAYDSLTPKQRRFVDAYVGRARLSAHRAYIMAGYSERSAKSNAYRLMENDGIRAAISERLSQMVMTDEEAAFIISEQARGSMEMFLREGYNGQLEVDLSTAEAKANQHLIKKIKQRKKVLTSEDEGDLQVLELYTEIEIYNAHEAAHKIREAHGAYKQRVDLTSGDEPITGITITVRSPGESGDG